MRSGDKVVPFLLKRRIGPVGTVTELKVGDHEWNPTVKAGDYALRPDIPALGRRVILDWESKGMPPTEGSQDYQTPYGQGSLSPAIQWRN
jgi:hypothetical protein